MDRIDDLLIKARAEMIGKAPKRNVVTKDVAFNMAWDMVKGYEDQMRALQEKRNNPGFFGRMKNAAKRGYQSARASRTQQNQTPLPTRSNEMGATTQNTGDSEFVDTFGQQDGLEPPSPTRASRASGSPPSMEALGPGGLGQGGGAETPQALEPDEVPMRDEDINTEQPVEAESARGSPPSFPGQSPSVRAQISGRPSDQRLLDAFNTLMPDQQEQNYKDVTRRNVREKEPTDRAVNEFFTPGEAGSVQAPTQAPNTETLQEADKFFDPSVPKNVHGRPIPEREPRGMIGTGSRTTSKEPATTAVKPSDLPMRRKQPATQALPLNQIPMRPQLPEQTGAKPPRRGSTKGRRTPISMSVPRPDIEEINLPARTRRNMRNKRNKEADRIEAERTPAPQPEPKVEEQSEPVKKPKPKPKVEEKTKPVKKPEPQVEEQTTKNPPTAKQTTLFGEEKTESVKPKKDTDTVEAAQERKAKRAKKNQPQEQEEKLPSINSMTDSSVLNELMDRAEDGDEKARKHLYNRMGDLEDHHPSVAERYKDTFENMVQDANLSLLPSGMRQSILKDNNTDVNYSLLPNGWV